MATLTRMHPVCVLYFDVIPVCAKGTVGVPSRDGYEATQVSPLPFNNEFMNYQFVNYFSGPKVSPQGIHRRGSLIT